MREACCDGGFRVEHPGELFGHRIAATLKDAREQGAQVATPSAHSARGFGNRGEGPHVERRERVTRSRFQHTTACLEDKRLTTLIVRGVRHRELGELEGRGELAALKA
jgi:hypothetical protein